MSQKEPPASPKQKIHKYFLLHSYTNTQLILTIILPVAADISRRTVSYAQKLQYCVPARTWFETSEKVHLKTANIQQIYIFTYTSYTEWHTNTPFQHPYSNIHPFHTLRFTHYQPICLYPFIYSPVDPTITPNKSVTKITSESSTSNEFSRTHDSYAACSGTKLKETSDKGTLCWFLRFLPRSPLIAISVHLRMAKRSRVRIWLTTWEYSSPRLAEMSSASLLW